MRRDLAARGFLGLAGRKSGAVRRHQVDARGLERALEVVHRGNEPARHVSPAAALGVGRFPRRTLAEVLEFRAGALREVEVFVALALEFGETHVFLQEFRLPEHVDGGGRGRLRFSNVCFYLGSLRHYERSSSTTSASTTSSSASAAPLVDAAAPSPWGAPSAAADW